MKRAAMVITIAALLWGCGKSEGTKSEKPMAKPVTVALVTMTGKPEPTQYSGVLAPDAQTEMAFRIPGYVTELLQAGGGAGRGRAAEAGTAVAAGAVLARLRPAEYQAVLDRARSSEQEAEAGIRGAEAQLAQAEANAKQAELEHERIERLWQQESVTKPAYDGSLAKRDSARAGVNAARAAIAAARQRAAVGGAQAREAEIALGDTTLTAPYAGVILERRVERGALVAAGAPVFALADLRRMKVLFHVPDVALAQLKPGQEVPVTVAPFPDKPFPGRILAIARSADPRSRSFEVQLILDNAEGKLRAGMIATVAISEPNPAPLPAVPAAALTHDPVNGRYQLYVVKEVGGQLVVRRQYADTKPAGNGLVAITNGAVQMGDRIVTRGAMLLEDGDVVVEVKP